MSGPSTASGTRAATRVARTFDARDIRLLLRRPHFVVFEYQELFTTVWLGRPDGLSLVRLHAEMDRSMARFPDGIHLLSVFEPGADPPPPHERELMRAYYDEHATRLTGHTVLLDGGGFWASTIMSAATAQRSGSRARFPERVARSETEAALYVSATFPRGPLSRVENVLESIRMARSRSAALARV